MDDRSLRMILLGLAGVVLSGSIILLLQDRRSMVLDLNPQTAVEKAKPRLRMLVDRISMGTLRVVSVEPTADGLHVVGMRHVISGDMYRMYASPRGSALLDGVMYRTEGSVLNRLKDTGPVLPRIDGYLNDERVAAIDALPAINWGHGPNTIWVTYDPTDPHSLTLPALLAEYVEAGHLRVRIIPVAEPENTEGILRAASILAAGDVDALTRSFIGDLDPDAHQPMHVEQVRQSIELIRSIIPSAGRVSPLWVTPTELGVEFFFGLPDPIEAMVYRVVPHGVR